MLHRRDLGEGADLVLTSALLRGDLDAVDRALATGRVHAGRLQRVWERGGLAARVHRAAAELGRTDALPPDAAEWARTRSLELWATGQRQLAEAERVAARLADAPWHLWVGGPVRSVRLHDDGGRRVSDRMDLVVPREAVPGLLDALRTDGWDRLDPAPVAVLQRWSDAVVLVGHDVGLEVRWAVPGLRASELRALGGRATSIRSAGTELRCATLDDELILLALRAHEAHQQGELDLGTLDDVRTLALALDDDRWASRWAHWHQLGVAPVVTAVLLLAVDVLGGDEELPHLVASMPEWRERLGRLGERLGPALLVPGGPDRWDRAAWGALRGGGPVGATLELASRRSRSALARAATQAWKQSAALREQVDIRSVDRDRRALRVPVPHGPPPARPGEIFVALASFRDPECATTIHDLFATATSPERVRVGVFLQVDDRWDGDCEVEGVGLPGHVRVWRVPAERSLGVCWARAEAQRLWQGEEHVLQVDSHSRFAPGWDARLLEELAGCEALAEKPYLTGYPPAYRLGRPLRDEARPFALETLLYEDGIVRTHAVEAPERPPTPTSTPFVAGGFWFARSELIHEVPYDPYLAYDHEEVALALRLFTHGWTGFVLRDALVFHLYGDDKPKDHRRRAIARHPQRDLVFRLAQQRFDHLIGHRTAADARALSELARYEVGSARSIDEFEDRTGIRFWDRTFRNEPITEPVPHGDHLAEVVPLHRLAPAPAEPGSALQP